VERHKGLQHILIKIVLFAKVIAWKKENGPLKCMFAVSIIVFSDFVLAMAIKARSLNDFWLGLLTNGGFIQSLALVEEMCHILGIVTQQSILYEILNA